MALIDESDTDEIEQERKCVKCGQQTMVSTEAIMQANREGLRDEWVCWDCFLEPRGEAMSAKLFNRVMGVSLILFALMQLAGGKYFEAGTDCFLASLFFGMGQVWAKLEARQP